jgi:hypothetical protein
MLETGCRFQLKVDWPQIPIREQSPIPNAPLTRPSATLSPRTRGERGHAVKHFFTRKGVRLTPRESPERDLRFQTVLSLPRLRVGFRSIVGMPSFVTRRVSRVSEGSVIRAARELLHRRWPSSGHPSRARGRGTTTTSMTQRFSLSPRVRGERAG